MSNLFDNEVLLTVTEIKPYGTWNAVVGGEALSLLKKNYSGVSQSNYDAYAYGEISASKSFLNKD